MGVGDKKFGVVLYVLVGGSGENFIVLFPTIACKNNETLHILVIFFTCVPPSPH